MPFSPVSAPPPSSGRHAFTRDFLQGLIEDLSIRIEWLEQSLASVREGSGEALVALRGHAKALSDLRGALEKVAAHTNDARFRRAYALDGPLSAYVSRVCAWGDEIAVELERRAALLRRLEPAPAVFPHKMVSKTYAEFEAIAAAVKKTLVESGSHDLDATVEEMLWAVEWLHMGLARVTAG